MTGAALLCELDCVIESDEPLTAVNVSDFSSTWMLSVLICRGRDEFGVRRAAEVDLSCLTEALLLLVASTGRFRMILWTDGTPVPEDVYRHFMQVFCLMRGECDDDHNIRGCACEGPCAV